MCRRFATGGSRVAVVDINGAAAGRAGEEIGGFWFSSDVASESHTQPVVTEVEDRLDPIGLYCANADIGMEGGVDTSVIDRMQHVADMGIEAFSWSFRNRGIAVPPERVRVALRGSSGLRWPGPVLPAPSGTSAWW